MERTIFDDEPETDDTETSTGEYVTDARDWSPCFAWAVMFLLLCAGLLAVAKWVAS